jgi:predicted HD phosphohydrolase
MNELGPVRPTLSDVLALLDQAGSTEEPNEEIVGLTILNHGLQCGDRLRHSYPDDAELQVAGLLHDVGHVLAPGDESHHGTVAAEFIRPLFGDRVATIIEDHVPAKRYLVATDASYRGLLSEGSLRTLTTQGGSMEPGQVAEFEHRPHFAAAVRLRRADEAAKDPHGDPPPLASWVAMLETLAQ